MDEAPVHFQNEYYGQTTLHPVGLAALIVLGLAMLALPRRWAVVPALVLICFVPSSQRVVIAGLDFTFMRLMIVFGWIRLLVLREYREFFWRPLDTAIVLWAVATLALGTRTSGGDLAALVKYLGHTYDALGAYFLGRCLIRSWDDVATIARACIVISVPVAMAFLIEYRTGRNVFSVFGGVPEITNIRDGRLRCQGAFAHPILAGCFWASLLPLMAAQAWRGWRIGACIGVTCGVLIIGLCASSTPVFAMLAGIGATVFALFSQQTRKWIIRLAFVGLIALHFIREAPIWQLLGRVSVVGGSSGRHRYRLIDAAIEHVDEWWVAGSTLGTDHWGRGLFDVTNYYLAQGLRGGLPLLLLFLAMLWVAFAAARKTRLRVHRDFDKLILVAALAVSLFQHAASLFGVTYFGQIMLLWYLLLAMIGSMDARSLIDARNPEIIFEDEETLVEAEAAEIEAAEDESLALGEDEEAEDELVVDLPEDIWIGHTPGPLTER